MALLHEEDHGKKETKMEEKKEGLQTKKTDLKKGGKNNKPHEKRRCNFCGIVGHISKDCRKREAKMGGCFHCGETGHQAKDFPKKKGQG